MELMSVRIWLPVAAYAVLCAGRLCPQVIEFESGGLRYQTLSRRGLTVMFAHLPAHLKEYEILQVGVSNGSSSTCTVRPEDFIFQKQDGGRLYATSAKTVVDGLLERATRSDVIKLISTYENSLNGITRFRSTNGYEQRRQSALAELGGNRLKAAAAASAIALVETRLDPGESTDGAVFFSTLGKPLGPGRILVRAGGQFFEFDSQPTPPSKTLQQRGSSTADPDPGR
jgi:hypothetical protein